jgi:hypothetical protein
VPGGEGQSATPPGTNRYEIRVAGHVDVRRARALGCDECRWLPDGDSILVATDVDQAATYGLIARIRDAGLELIAVARIPAAVRSGVPSDPRDGQA